MSATQKTDLDIENNDFFQQTIMERDADIADAIAKELAPAESN